MTAQNKIINDLEQYLKYQIEEGHISSEISPEIIKKLSEKKIQKNKPEPLTVSVQAENPVKKERPESTTSNLPPATRHLATQKTINKEPPSNMEEISVQISNCKKCSLFSTRTHTVPGQGNNSPEIMFIGEAPGAKEDELGIPFVGRSGNFLTKMIEAMGYTREEVFIGNILKCRPPENRKPTAQEIEICIPYLKQQIAILKPKVIIALGSTSVQGLIGKTPAISKLRGQWLEFEGTPLMPTFHPAYILRNQSKKGELWSDLKKVLAFIGKTPPPIKKS